MLYQPIRNFLKTAQFEYIKEQPAECIFKPAYTIDKEDTLENVMNLVITHHIHRVYIVQEDNKPRGVVKSL